MAAEAAGFAWQPAVMEMAMSEAAVTEKKREPLVSDMGDRGSLHEGVGFE